MDEGFLSLKWNNHKAAFFTILRVLREKRSYTDVTIACDNKFFDVHKIVLMACSEYFSELFEHTHCKNPVIVLKDVASSDLEALLDYMYLGEVDVQQKTLPGLIKAAECLKIKGLAAPDDDGGGGGTTKTRGNTSEFEKPSNKRRRVDRDNDKNSPAPLPPSSRVRRQSQASEGNHISHNLMDKDVDLRKDVSQTPLSPGNDERVPHLHCTTEMVTSPQYTSHEDHDARYGEMPPPPQDNYHDPNHTNRSDDMSPGAEAFQPIMEIKTEQSEVELENGTLKHESSEGHEDPQQHHKDSGGVSDLSHFLTAAMEEAVVPPHLFSGVQQAGPSGMHRQGMPEEGNYGSEDPRAVGMYPPHLLGGEAAHEAQPGQEALQENKSPDTSRHRPNLSTPTVDAAQLQLFQQSEQQQQQLQQQLQLQCPHCARVFTDRYKRDRHLMIHTGEKPYQCPLCPYRSSRRDPVTRHIRFRHRDLLIPATEPKQNSDSFPT